jgi:Reverse transcriptase (RNA-dependent DNA polymerase)
LFWNFIKSKTSSDSLPQTIILDDLSAHNGQDIVNLFAKHFSSVYIKSKIPVNDFSLYSNSHTNINNIDLPLDDIYNYFTKLNNRTQIGPDGLSVHFIKSCINYIVIPIHYLFNLSISTGSYPDYWKTSYITPIPKTGNLADVKNYRPISIISILPKTLEDLISKKISPLFKNILSNSQHGFRSKRSTNTNLISFYQTILKYTDDGYQADVIYTDFSKAFDRVNHFLLSQKLNSIGISNPLLSWFTSFITNRIQIVKHKNYFSSPIYVSSGVPQGSHLSPLMFNIFLNDINSVLRFAKLYSFADDCKFIGLIKSIDDTKLLQLDIDAIIKWCSNNEMYLNIPKCNSISFHRIRNPIIFSYNISNIILPAVLHITDLGIIFESNLSFNLYISKMINNSSRRLGFIRRHCNDFTNPLALKSIYCSLVRSCLDYNSTLWSPCQLGLIKEIEAIQNRFLRFISINCNIHREPHSPYTPLLNFLHLDTLEVRRKKVDLYFLYKLLNNLIDSPELLSMINIKTPLCKLRSVELFYLSLATTNLMSNSPIYRIMKLANIYNVDLFVNYFCEFKILINLVVK